MTIMRKREIVPTKSIAVIAFQEQYFLRKSLARNVTNIASLNVEYAKGTSMLNENERISDIRRALDGEKREDIRLILGSAVLVVMVIVIGLLMARMWGL